MARFHAEAAIVMGGPREAVFEAITNEFNDWSVGKYTRSHRVTKREGNIVEREIERRFWGMTLRYRERDELTPPSKMLALAENNIMKVTTAIRFESERDGGTRVAVTVDAEIKGALAGVFGPVARRRFHRDWVNVGGEFAKYKGWGFRVIGSSSV